MAGYLGLHLLAFVVDSLQSLEEALAKVCQDIKLELTLRNPLDVLKELALARELNLRELKGSGVFVDDVCGSIGNRGVRDLRQIQR